MKKTLSLILAGLTALSLSACAMAEETVNVVNPKGTVLMENAPVMADENGTPCVGLGNGFRLYAGVDDTMKIILKVSLHG